MLALELEVNVSCAKSALWWSCMVVYISHICAFHVEGQSVSGVTLSRTIFLLLKDEKFSEECSKYFSSVLRSNCLEILYCFADVRYLDIKPWGTPRNHGNLKVQTSTWKKGNYSLEWKHIPFDFQHTSDGKNYYSCSVDSRHFFFHRERFHASYYTWWYERKIASGSHLACSTDSETHHFIWYKFFFFLLDLTGILFQSKPFGASFLPWNWSREWNSH